MLFVFYSCTAVNMCDCHVYNKFLLTYLLTYLLTSTGSPVHVLTLSIQAVRGLSRLRPPGILLAFSLSPVNTLVSSWYDHDSMLASLL